MKVAIVKSNVKVGLEFMIRIGLIRVMGIRVRVRVERRKEKLPSRRRRPWSCEEHRCYRASEERKRDREEREGQGRRKHATEKGALLAPLHLVVVAVGAAAGCAIAVELGTRYSSSIFSNRAPPGQLLLLNFIGGATNPGMLSKKTRFNNKENERKSFDYMENGPNFVGYEAPNLDDGEKVSGIIKNDEAAADEVD
ncbi:hypothetical protein Ahy_B02g060675 [Arachis hypogaea]|uniref:Uncharacterized protein n=1 Tax=Arachis hypogaea TaxID=3818 RepID=A0A445AJ80_ARAHY|nr:hypothetical protein Ahy_B02g060675 [Arachis hypogaea]